MERHLLRVLNGFLDLGCLQLTQTVCINAERVLASCTILAHLSAEPARHTMLPQRWSSAGLGYSYAARLPPDQPKLFRAPRRSHDTDSSRHTQFMHRRYGQAAEQDLPLSMQPVTIAWRTVVAHSKLNLHICKLVMEHMCQSTVPTVPTNRMCLQCTKL